MTRHVADAGLSAMGLRRSIAARLLSPALWRRDPEFISFAACMVAVVVFLAVHGIAETVRASQDIVSRARRSVLIFLVTPFGAYGSVPGDSMQIRLSNHGSGADRTGRRRAVRLRLQEDFRSRPTAERH